MGVKMATDRKAQMLEAAYEILGQEGLEGLHARSVAARVGVNHAAVHYYFPRRLDLIDAVIDYAVDRFHDDVRNFRAKASGPAQHLETDLALFEAYCRPTSRFFRVWASLFVAGQAEPTIRAKLEEFSSAWTATLEQSLNLAHAAGRLNEASDYADAELLATTVLGLGLRAQVGSKPADAGPRFDRLAESLLKD